MLTETSYLAAFMVALLGGVHCVGMCGGIVGAITLGLSESTRSRFTAMLPYLLAYNLGRITSYTVAGALAGGVGAWTAHLASIRYGQQALQLIAGLFMILLGLYLGSWWQGLTRLERAGASWWRRIEPLGRRWLPIHTPGQALGLGLVWGWLPCGLVYSVVIWSVSAGGAVQGALLMLCFGLGTLPTLLAMGTFAATLATWVRRPWVRRLAGGLIMGFAGYQIKSALGF